MVAQGLRFRPTTHKPVASGFSMAQPQAVMGMWGVSQQMEDPPVSVCLCPSAFQMENENKSQF